MKSLGCWFDKSLKDINQVKETSRTLQEGLQKIDRSPQQEKFKVDVLTICLFRCYYGRPLGYKIAKSMLESVEAKINRYTRKWLGLSQGLSDVAMYCRRAKLKLSFVEDFKSGKIRLQMMLDKTTKTYIENRKEVESQGHHKKS